MGSKSNVIQFKKKESKESKEAEEANFKNFAQLVAAGSIPEASKCLQKMLNIDYEVAEKACMHFSKLYLEDENTIFETMKMRNLLTEGKQNEALVVIQKLFGLSGVELIAALEAIKKMI